MFTPLGPIIRNDLAHEAVELSGNFRDSNCVLQIIVGVNTQSKRIVAYTQQHIH